MSKQVVIIGTGLIGTSLGMALTRAGWRVWLADSDSAAQEGAEALGAGRVLGATTVEPDLVIVAVPPNLTADVVVSALDAWPGAVVTDVASVKAPVLDRLQATSQSSLHRFVGGHPMAGREVSGPGGALPELFQDRPWVLTPSASVEPEAMTLVLAAVAAVGAIPIELSAQEHDRAVALTSHSPQVLASLLANRLNHATEEQVLVAGQGLRDTIRVAASDPDLWADILTANSEPLRSELVAIATDLQELIAELTTGGSSGRESAYRLVSGGRNGIRRLPGKHGQTATRYRSVRVAVPDEPGALAQLFAAAAEAGVNLEDVRIEHALGRPTGLVELSVALDQADTLYTTLAADGWSLRS